MIHPLMGLLCMLYDDGCAVWPMCNISDYRFVGIVVQSTQNHLIYAVDVCVYLLYFNFTNCFTSIEMLVSYYK